MRALAAPGHFRWPLLSEAPETLVSAYGGGFEIRRNVSRHPMSLNRQCRDEGDVT